MKIQKWVVLVGMVVTVVTSSKAADTEKIVVTPDGKTHVTFSTKTGHSWIHNSVKVHMVTPAVKPSEVVVPVVPAPPVIVTNVVQSAPAVVYVTQPRQPQVIILNWQAVPQVQIIQAPPQPTYISGCIQPQVYGYGWNQVYFGPRPQPWCFGDPLSYVH